MKKKDSDRSWFVTSVWNSFGNVIKGLKEEVFLDSLSGSKDINV